MQTKTLPFEVIPNENQTSFRIHFGGYCHDLPFGVLGYILEQENKLLEFLNGEREFTFDLSKYQSSLKPYAS